MLSTVSCRQTTLLIFILIDNDISGSLFDLREFNEEVLKYGTVPLSVLEEIISDWVKEKKEMKSTQRQIKVLPILYYRTNGFTY